MWSCEHICMEDELGLIKMLDDYLLQGKKNQSNGKSQKTKKNKIITTIKFYSNLSLLKSTHTNNTQEFKYKCTHTYFHNVHTQYHWFQNQISTIVMVHLLIINLQRCLGFWDKLNWTTDNKKYKKNRQAAKINNRFFTYK